MPKRAENSDIPAVKWNPTVQLEKSVSKINTDLVITHHVSNVGVQDAKADEIQNGSYKPS